RRPVQHGPRHHRTSCIATGSTSEPHLSLYLQKQVQQSADRDTGRPEGSAVPRQSSVTENAVAFTFGVSPEAIAVEVTDAQYSTFPADEASTTATPTIGLVEAPVAVGAVIAFLFVTT